MKKIILSFAATWCMTSALFAVPASPSPFVYHQPDGSQLTLFTNGDEYYNWLETPDKDIVISNNGYYEYATIVNDSLVPSGIRVSVQPNSEQKNKLSTRAEILKKLVHIKYLNLNKKTQIITPTLLGEMIYEVVAGSIKPLLDPRLTASWEKGLTLVAEGEITEEEYMVKLDDFITRRTNSVKQLNNQAALYHRFHYASQFYKK